MVVALPVVGGLWAAMASWFSPTVLFCLLNLMIGTIFITSNFKPHPDKNRPGGEPYRPHLARRPSLLERVRSIDFSFYRPDQFEPETHHINPPHEEAVTKNPEQDAVPDTTHDEAPAEEPEQESVTGPTQEEAPTNEVELEAVPEPTRLSRTPSLLERVWSNIPFRVDPPKEEAPAFEQDPIRIVRARSILEQMRSVNFSFRRFDPVEGGKSETQEHHVTRSKSAGSGGEREAPERITKSASERAVAPQEDEEVDAKADDFINRFKQQLKLQRLDSLLRRGR